MKRSQAPSNILIKRGIREEQIKAAMRIGFGAISQLLQTGTIREEAEEEEEKVKDVSMESEDNIYSRNIAVVPGGSNVYYWCVYENKEKDQKPGILEVGYDKIIVYTMEGKQTASGDITRGEIYEVDDINKENVNQHVKVETQDIKMGNKPVIIDTGKVLSLSKKRVKVLINFSAEKYINGSIFLQKPPTEQECEKIVQKKIEKKKSMFVGRTLLSRKVTDFVVPYKNAVVQRKRTEPLFNPNDPDAVVLYKPSVTSKGQVAVVVDPILSKKLRPHQRIGVKFMYDCVMGFKEGFKGNGCILADGMGLGKTIQAVTLLWTLLRQGPSGEPTCKKAMVVCPSSLVGNWENEFKKWLGDSAPRVVSVSSSGKKSEKAITDMDFGYAEIMVISYDQLRIHIDQIAKIKGWGLLICDEGHRLKNADIKSSQAVNRVPTMRRVILSGTPIQNDLKEFYAMVSFVNPDVLGTLGTFRHIYEEPILKSRQSDCTPEEKFAGNQRSKELTRLTKLFILRRTSKVNQKYLPPKVQHIVFCSLTPLQKKLYTTFCNMKLKNGCQFQILTALKKISNHPWLVQDFVETFPEISDILPKGEALWDMELSGKTSFLAKLLRNLRKNREKIVIVSNYTETLNFLAHYCNKCGYPYIQLDGSIQSSKRTQMVNQFNNAEYDSFIFLLSSKAGGCGLNLVGGANLVMFDPDWNPANDEQAMGRVWRDGQKKKCHIYRTLSAGTVEEKMYQRQVKKLELAGKVVEGGDDNDESTFDDKQLKDLCTYKETCCETHDLLGCTCGATSRKNIDWTKNDGKLEVLRKEWKHYPGSGPFDDETIQQLNSKTISFLFSKEDAQLKEESTEEIVEEKMEGDSDEEEEEEEQFEEREYISSDYE